MIRTGDTVVAEVMSSSVMMWKRGRVTEAFRVGDHWEYDVLLGHSFGQKARVDEFHIRKIATGRDV